MQDIDHFEKRLKDSTQTMSRGQVKLAQMQFKRLQRDVRVFFQQSKIEQNDKLSQIQIAIYNNLACIYEKKGKYKSSLYHLSLAQKLENAYITHKYNDKSIPITALEKLATTYSNLSAIQSKLGNTNQALEDIQFAIQIMKKNEQLSNHQNFIFLYYNYAVLLQGANRIQQASENALEGMRIVNLLKEVTLKQNYEELLKGLKNQLRRQQERKQRHIQKYLKAQIGVFKPLKQLQVSFQQMSKYEPVEQQSKQIYRTLAKKRQSAEDFAVYTRQKLSFYRPRVQTQISNHRTKRSASGGILQNNIKDRIIRNNQISETGYKNRPKELMNRTTEGIIQAYRFVDRFGLSQKRKKQFSTLSRETIDRRIKQKRNKLEYQIDQLGLKNEVLQKVIEKLYMAQQTKDLPVKNANKEL